ncbi:MAG TPA: YHS domain-containing protein [Tepidisphaeraceae bacterium]|jgi:YHS domain-containing protein
MWKYVLLLAVVATGCTSAQPPATLNGKPCAQCLVCKKNADLACVDVEVDANTPKYEYNGQTYYFCSDDCRDKFIKDPSQYVKK